MTMGDDDPRGVVSLDSRGINGWIYVEYLLILLHTKYTRFRPCGLWRRRFLNVFPQYKPMADNNAPGA